MVAISKTIFLLVSAAVALAATPAPTYPPTEMAQVVDCQAQCISIPPPFHHPKDITVQDYMKVNDHGRMKYMVHNIQTVAKPCYKDLKKLKGNSTLVTEPTFQAYVECNSKTLTAHEQMYAAKTFNYKKEGFTAAQWNEFRAHTLPGFRKALHTCRAGCRRIHFAHKGAPKP